MITTLLVSATAAAAPFRDDVRGLSLDVPDGYHDIPNPSPQALHAWARGEAGAPGYTAIVLQGVGGTIGREPLDRATVERSARASVAGSGLTITGFEYGTARWQSFDLEVVATRVTGGDQDSVMVAVQIPLAPEAAQLMLSGPATSETRMRADLAQVLGSLRGRSNWLTVQQRSEKLGTALGLGFTALAVAVIAWWRWRPRRAVAGD
ncbi:MAG: hypothetical protein JWM10_642 [Myxococcaceae bacterium]|nr:hypothetical protein [Myxococcaceae bacterium]